MQGRRDEGELFARVVCESVVCVKELLLEAVYVQEVYLEEPGEEVCACVCVCERVVGDRAVCERFLESCAGKEACATPATQIIVVVVVVCVCVSRVW